MEATTISRGFRYVYSGQLTGTVNDVPAAQAYLTEDEMVQYLDGLPTVMDVRWDLKADGRTYEVIALSAYELDETEISDLTEWVKGQHSDGLGEGFEQQDFAVDADFEEPEYDYDDDIAAFGEDQNDMVSFDWKTNDTQFVKVDRFGSK